LESAAGAEEQDAALAVPSPAAAYVTLDDGPGFVWVRSTCEGAQPFTTSTDVLTIDWSAS
jgi:hypothetical protein